jgi:hypothetical protein
MDTITMECRWTGADTGAFAAWVADRSAADPVHCVRIDAVGRNPSGRLAVRTEFLRGTRLPDALDRIGVPSVGVAVTLTVPLLELAVDARAGAVLLGDARAEDVLVDDSGATVLVDRPPGTDPPGTDLPGTDPPGTDPPGTDPPGTDLPGTHPPGTGLPDVDATDAGPPAGAARAPAMTLRRKESPGSLAVLHAVRMVWERVDPREPCRAAVDHAVAEALDGDVDTVRRLLAVVRATSAPRPVRWDPPHDDFDFIDPVPPPTTGVSAAVRRFLEQGLVLPGGTRMPARRVLVGAVVAVGAASAGVIALGGGS